jgi:hypothetical protein
MSITDSPEHERPEEMVLANECAAPLDDKLLTILLRIRVTSRAFAGGDVKDRCR